MPATTQESTTAAAMAANQRGRRPGNSSSRSGLLRQLLTWHWISSALSLCGMLLFAVTGFTLNHAGQISAEPTVQAVEAALPEPLLKALTQQQDRKPGESPGLATLPDSLAVWLQSTHGINVSGGIAEWSEYELYIALPRPGGDAWLSIGLPDGALVYEETDRGWIAYLNDLHKGRNTGTAWSWFIDVFALGCVVFCITGLAVLWLHSRERAAVWPVTGLGVLVPLLLVLLLVH